MENVQIILEAIDQQKGIECEYLSFDKSTKKPQKLIPYFLKTWEQRWYLAAEPDNHHHGISIFALERMENIRLTEQKMKPSNNITADEYFEGSFGINHSDDQKAERIVIKVYGAQANYVRALPIHESQKHYRGDKEAELRRQYPTLEGGAFFSIDCIENYELIRELISFREDLIVLSPDNIRDTVIERITAMYEMYKPWRK